MTADYNHASLKENIMWILKNEILGESGTYDTNFLFNQGKFYIMDNHLAAAWCWMQKVNLENEVGFFHIDRHYDLLNNLSEEYITEQRRYFTGTFEEYMQVKDTTTGDYPAVRFDNYIDIFRKLFPNVINKYYFATHDDGTYLDEIDSYKPEIWELQDNISYWLERDASKWIVNIDLDYFFHERECIEFQMLTDEYIIQICKEIEKSIDKIDVVTIALSPNFCGGWKNSFKALKVITDFFEIKINPDWEIEE